MSDPTPEAFASVLLGNVGWLATAVFTASYFARRERVLRLLQVAGAALWLVYGVVVEAPPVIVANLLVLAAAVGTTWVRRPPRVAGAREVARRAEQGPSSRKAAPPGPAPARR